MSHTVVSHSLHYSKQSKYSLIHFTRKLHLYTGSSAHVFIHEDVLVTHYLERCGMRLNSVVGYTVTGVNY